MKHIAILDFGSQYTHLIARAVREIGVLAKIYLPSDDISEWQNDAWGIILSGGPQSVYDSASPQVDDKIFNLELPILGICYGHQLIAHKLGGKIKKGIKGEYGKTILHITNSSSKIFKNVKTNSTIWMSHQDEVTNLPPSFEIVAKSKHCSNIAMANEEKNIYGFQFHPEVHHSEQGPQMIENFVINICKAKKEWHVENLINDIKKEIKKQVGDKKVFMLVSGGVDSNVAYALINQAIGQDRVIGQYIDTGFMRKNETEEIVENYHKAGMDNLRTTDASDYFFDKIKNVFDPEEKRARIGQGFIDIKNQVAKELKLDSGEWLLGQGTIYPDTITSGGTKHSDKIKTHHNRVDEIKKLLEKGLVVEPLKEFYKDEVRALGRAIGLPPILTERQPFPGPGLAVRVLPNNPKNPVNTASTQKKINELFQKNYPNIKNQVLPVRSVGVQGDNRTYAMPLAVWGETDWEKLDQISVSTTNTVKDINRVILSLNPNDKPIIGLEDIRYTSPERINVVREIKYIVDEFMKEMDIYKEIWQFPIALLPVTDSSDKESIVLRPFNSRDVMTLNFFRMTPKHLKKLKNRILETNLISYLFYDLSNKPPGTVEWE